ncbi:MAG TPA: creatininase family protein, partial [Kouleothrix sp.]|nr:creatininase family protein [Kouleothrix sp.]
MTDTAPWGRYAELRPADLDRIVAAAPIAYVPWGALEWHGSHLPFGLEGIAAEALAERVVQRTGGVLLPPTWWAITTLPHRFSLSIQSEVIQALWDGVFAELARAGFHMVVVISGHYAEGHELVLIDAAEHAMAQHGLLVLAIPPLALVDETMLDHAAHWETALMLALRPKLVDLTALAPAPLDPSTSAVLGEVVALMQLAGFDLIVVETAGTGQSDSEIADLADVPVYVMTGEYGAPSQLEKIDMLDYAEFVVLNKFEKGGAEDAL